MKRTLVKILLCLLLLGVALDVTIELLFGVDVTPQLVFPVKAAYLTISCTIKGKRPYLVFVEDYLTIPSGCAEKLPDGTWDKPVFIFMRGSDIGPEAPEIPSPNVNP